MKIIIFIVLIFISCSNKSEGIIEKAEKEKLIDTKNIKWDEIAEFISGIESPNSSSYLKFTNENFYKVHKVSMDTTWNKIQNEYISKVKKWSDENLPQKNRKNTAFYPLSGADFINLYHFAPDTNKYIMIGLETPGFILEPNDFTSPQMKQSLELIKLTIMQNSRQNYFSTNLMEYKFKNKIFPGVAPIFFVFLKRLGFIIDDLVRVQISPDGNLININENEVSEKAESLQGIKIHFHKQGEAVKARELIFLKMYINEDSANLDKPEGKFFNKLSRLNIIMKSAIYLMHIEKYKSFLDTILAKTDMVIEDDSGIPIKYFPQDTWDIQGFGFYKSRISIKYVSREANMFKTDKGNLYSEQKKFTQEELIKIFETNGKPLDFKYGYGAASGRITRSNLILATRKELKK